MPEFIDPDSNLPIGYEDESTKSESKFLDPDASEFKNAEKDPTAPAKEQGGGFLETAAAAAGGVLEGRKRVIEGGKQLALEAAEKIGLTSEGKAAQYTKEVEEARAVRREQLRQQFPGHETATSVGEFVGETAPYLVAPGGAFKSILKSLATASATGAGIGAAQFVPEGGSRLANTAIGAVAAPAVVGAIRGAKGLIDKALPTAKKGVKDVIKLITPEKKAAIETSQEAAHRLGVKLTPGEATASGPIQGMEKRLPIKPETQAEIAQIVENRSAAMTKKFNKVINEIVPEGKEKASAAVSKMYKDLETKSLADDKLSKLLENPSIAKRLATITKSTDSVISDLPNNSVAKLDGIKRLIDDELYTGTSLISKTSRSLSSDEKTALRAARKLLVDTMDEAIPSYAPARKVSQRLILQGKMEEALDKVKLEPGQTRATADQMYNALASTPEKIKFLIDGVRDSGGNVQQARDVIKILNLTQNSSLKALSTKDPNMRSVQFGKGWGAQVLEKTQHFLQGKYNKGILELMLNPNWEKEVAKIMKADGLPTKMDKLTGLLGKVAATLAGD